MQTNITNLTIGNKNTSEEENIRRNNITEHIFESLGPIDFGTKLQPIKLQRESRRLSQDDHDGMT